MSWNFRRMARTSTLSESTFSEGEQVVCLIYKDFANGEIGRADIRLEEEAYFELPGKLLGRWVRFVEESKDKSTAVRDKLTSAEDFFFSLYESPKYTGSNEEIDALKSLLALMLERKRIVRAQGKRAREGIQPYLHIKTKQTLDVPVIDISASIMLRIQETIGDILL